MSKRLYVAYGSNLNIRQMKYRCPTAKLYGTGVIENYELQFKGHPESAFATIAPKEGASVPVAVWKIQPKDEQSLDRYEGYPSHYFKQDVPVQLDGEEVSAMVYIMNLKMDFGIPSSGYYGTVYQGYQDCGLDVTVLNQAMEESGKRLSPSAMRQAQQNLFEDYDDEDYDEESELDEDDGEELNDEDCESDPFYFSDGMSM